MANQALPDRRGNFGLCRINNNALADGSGSDFNIFGDAGFRNGRMTPKLRDSGRDCSFVPRVKQNRCVMGVRQPPYTTSTHRMPTFDGSLPEHVASSRAGCPPEKGKAIAIRPIVQGRWDKHFQSATAVDPGPRKSPSAPELLAPLQGPAAERELALFQLEQAAKLQYSPTFPVPKYKYVVQSSAYHAIDGTVRDIIPSKRRDEIIVEPEKKPGIHKLPYKLEPSPIERYRQFSNPSVTQSPSFIAEHHDHGLSQNKKVWRFGMPEPEFD